MDNYIVYVQTDGKGRIVAVNSSAFLPDATGAALEGGGHA